MANTWFALFPDVAIGTANKSHADIWNPTGSGRVVRIYKVYVLHNYRSAAVTGGLNIYQLARITALSSPGTVVTPVRADSTAENWAATSCTAHYASTVTEGSIFRRIIRSSDEIGYRSAPQMDYWGSIHPMALIWNSANHEDTVIQPIVVREDTGIHVKYVSGTNSVATLTVGIEFTTDSS